MFQTAVLPGAHPAETLLQISGGAVLPRCLHAIANLGVADALGETPQNAAALAGATGAHAEALERALLLLAANGVFEHSDGVFRHNGASRLLRADHPQSMRPVVRMFGLPALWAVIGEIEHSVRTGLPSADKVLAGGIWGYFSSHSEEGAIFDQAMFAKAHGQVASVVASYDFSGSRTIGDIGGGRGHLLQAVLAHAPAARGVLFDRPRVVEQVASIASDRLTLRSGDFFTDALPACDTYLLMEVIHDWDDDHSIRILRQVHSAAPPRARVLLIEALVPEGPGPSWARTLDLWMLTITGKQRTLQEYASLLSRAGFEHTRAIDTPGGVSIVEGIRR
jgi:hypothetical protein